MSFILTINFNPSNPDFGFYRVKYWPTSDPTNITTTNVFTSPFVVYNLPECSYAGTLETNCGDGQYSVAQSFLVENCTTGGGDDDGTVVVENLAGTEGTPYASASIDDISPAWFFANSGSLPLGSGNNIAGVHSSFSGSFDVTVSNAGFGCCLVLYKNDSVYMSIPVNTSGTYTFSSVSFSSTDAVKLRFQSVPC